MTALEPGRHVTLELPELGRLPARVEAAGEGWVTLALFVRPQTPIAWLEQPHGSIECVTARGVERVDGSVAPDGAGLEASIRLELESEPRVEQRRDFVRVDATVPISVAVGSPDAPRVETHATNLSGSGFLVAGPPGLAPGDVLWFSLELPDGRPPVEGRARVVREADGRRKGCTIEEIDERWRELLVRFTFDRQRAELRVGRRA